MSWLSSARARAEVATPGLTAFLARVPDWGLAGAGCWPWKGARSKQGYGNFTVNGRFTLAHRYAFEVFCGPVGNHFVCHSCDQPSCVRPDHLWLGDPKANAQDAVAKGRHGNQKRSRCRSGHPLDGVRGNGSRYCKTCACERAARNRERCLMDPSWVERERERSRVKARRQYWLASLKAGPEHPA